MTKHIGLSQRPNTLMLLLILLLAGWAYSSQAEEKTRRLTLCVLDSATGDPIPGAIVRSEEALSAQPTDPQGHCTLSFPITKKRVTLTTSYLGYKSDSRTISLSEVRGVLTIRLEEDATLIDEVVVQGDLRQTSILQQTMKIDPKTLEKSSTLTLGQLLETVPGVSTISSGSTISKPVIQGMHSGRILLLNNGVRLDSQSWGSDHAPEIDHTGATNVEVVKGAESVRYGYGAIGGVVLWGFVSTDSTVGVGTTLRRSISLITPVTPISVFRHLQAGAMERSQPHSSAVSSTPVMASTTPVESPT